MTWLLCRLIGSEGSFDCFQSSMRVIHEGVDVDGLAGLRPIRGPRPECLFDDPEIEVLTYVSRCFEAYRGFSGNPSNISSPAEATRCMSCLLVMMELPWPPRDDGRGWAEWVAKICL